jgi:uncharacterized membrane protein required for colicin V production
MTLHAKTLAGMPLPNYFDAIVLLVLIWGLNKGRKHGMSEELMMTVQWVVIIFAGAFLYKPFGDMLAMSTPVSHLFWYITVYVTAAIITKIIFGLVKKGVGGKLVGSDVFGGAEYYLGMVAGAIRYSCMMIAFLAILHAPYYSAQDVAAKRAYDKEYFGETFFPSVQSVQDNVFKDSLIGNLVKQRAGVLLIASTKFEQVGVKRRKDDLP